MILDLITIYYQVLFLERDNGICNFTLISTEVANRQSVEACVAEWLTP